MGFEQAVMRYLSGEMMIEIAHARADPQRTEQSHPVGVQRNVEYGKFVSGLGNHSREKGYVALYPGYQRGCTRIGEPELVQRAQSIGVAIEDVIESHGVPPAADRQSPARHIANTT